MLSQSRNKLWRFAKDESGVIMTEFLIVLPLMTWTFMALVVWWDTWRTINEGQKAAYAVADLVTRQKEVNVNFINGMETVMEGLMGRPNVVSLRITSVRWVYDDIAERGTYSVIFSRSPFDRKTPLTASNINNDISHLIPVMNSGESTVIVETWTNYRPAFDVGIPVSDFRNFIVTKPRYYLAVCLTESLHTCPTAAV